MSRRSSRLRNDGRERITGLVIANGRVPTSLIDKFIPKHSKGRKKMVASNARGEQWVIHNLLGLVCFVDWTSGV